VSKLERHESPDLTRLRQEWAIRYREASSEPNGQDRVIAEYLALITSRRLIEPDDVSKIAESKALKAEAGAFPLAFTLPTISDDDARDGVPIYLGVLPLLTGEARDAFVAANDLADGEGMRIHHEGDYWLFSTGDVDVGSWTIRVHVSRGQAALWSPLGEMTILRGGWELDSAPFM
jgi:hypothetical protein